MKEADMDNKNALLKEISTDDLINEIKNRVGTETTVSINIFITDDGFDLDKTHKTPESLKDRGISMKNVFGRYIR